MADVSKTKLTNQEEKRLRRLFKKLDVDKDDKISITDLSKAFSSQQPQYSDSNRDANTRRVFDRLDLNKDGHIDFEEFVKYVVEKEKKLKISFAELDKNNDGYIDIEEIMQAFQKIGVDIDIEDAQRILVRMDKDRTLLINYNEWRDFHLLHDVSDVPDIVHYWRHNTTGHEVEKYIDHLIIDVGEDALVPDDFTAGEIQSGMWWRHLMAGAAAGAVSRTCTAPLDRLKVYIMVFSSKHPHLSLSSAWKELKNEGGWKGMWRGNGVNVMKIAPESAIKFMAYEHIKRLIRRGQDRELEIYERFIAGSLAGATAQTIIYPMEVLKTRLVLRKTKQYSGMIDCAIQIYKREGPRNFYRGYLPNLLGIIPYAGIDLAIYETLKRMYIKKHSRNEDPGVLVLIACGTVSSTCGQLASYPLSLVRTRLQAKPHWQGGGMLEFFKTIYREDGPPHWQGGGMLETFKTICREDGPRGLYRGILPNLMKVVPAVGISYIVYEHVRKLLGVTMT